MLVDAKRARPKWPLTLVRTAMLLAVVGILAVIIGGLATLVGIVTLGGAVLALAVPLGAAGVISSWLIR
jgi:hypothetical protein